MANYSRAHICQCLTRLATLKRNSTVTVASNRRKTGGEFVRGVLGLAGGLLRLGVRSGDVVAIAAFNSDWYLEWLLAVAFIGGIVAPLNYRWSFEEARTAILMVEPVLLVNDGSCSTWNIQSLASAVPSLKWLVSMDSSLSSSANNIKLLTTEILKDSSVTYPPMTYCWAPDGAVTICFTSGTTGRPKGVTISHSAIIVQSLAKVAIVGYDETDVYLHTAPLCHIGGLSSAMAVLMVGACHVLLPKFVAETSLKAIEEHQVTSLITVPAMMRDLIFVAWNHRYEMRLESVRKILNGGGTLPSDLLKDASNIFPRAKIISAYGMTETSSSLTFMTLYDPSSTPALEPEVRCTEATKLAWQPQGVCVGKPAPHIELKVQVAESSLSGKILTRGPHVMLRYWNQNQEKTGSPGDADWLDTGDIGSIDENGNLWLMGRSNGRIKTGGENVYPEEVEAVLLQHPGIVSAVVVGVPDGRLSEMVVACIRVNDGWKWSEDTQEHREENWFLLSCETLRRHCRLKNLTGFKIPKIFISWTKPFPVTTTGKVRREQVREQVISHFQVFSGRL